MAYSALLGALCCIRRLSQPLERFSLGSGDGQELNLASVCTVLTLHHIPAVRAGAAGVEPAAFCFGGRCSPPELEPQSDRGGPGTASMRSGSACRQRLSDAEFAELACTSLAHQHGGTDRVAEADG